MSEERPEPVELREWFADLEQQRAASTIGMWLFLTTEVLLFGGLFALYVAYRLEYSAEFHQASAHNLVIVGTINTVVLVTSSFFVAWAIHALRADKPRAAFHSLLGAVGLGLVFLVLKGIEYGQHFAHGIYPGHLYAFHELPSQGAKLFFTLYYFMTGLHALHVIGGMVALTVLALMVRRGRIRREYDAALENGGLYWHLVDLVWLFLWPLLYLAG